MTENKYYIHFVNDLKSKIRQAQYNAYRAVNTELITLYWEIGRSIVAKQEELGWGQNIVIIEKLNVAKYLTRNLPAEILKQLPAPSVIETKLKELYEAEEK